MPGPFTQPRLLVVTFERRVGDGGWTEIGTDDSSPAYTVFDDLSALSRAAGIAIAYRATLHDGDTTVVSDVRTVQFAGPPAEQAIVHYYRPAGDYADWGLHLWGDAGAPDVLASIAWARCSARTSSTVRRWLGGLRDPAADRRGTGQLHHAPPRRGLGPDTAPPRCGCLLYIVNE